MCISSMKFSFWTGRGSCLTIFQKETGDRAWAGESDMDQAFSIAHWENHRDAPCHTQWYSHFFCKLLPARGKLSKISFWALLRLPWLVPSYFSIVTCLELMRWLLALAQVRHCQMSPVCIEVQLIASRNPVCSVSRRSSTWAVLHGSVLIVFSPRGGL